VNWFRTDANGRFVWPGFGENARVLKWMLERIEGKAGGVEHVFGVTPEFADLDWNGLEFSMEEFVTITSIDNASWQEEFALHAELFERLQHGLPEALAETKSRLQDRLAA
jgi:phosphoenolpyruvate carboxykinase (GTP)